MKVLNSRSLPVPSPADDAGRLRRPGRAAPRFSRRSRSAFTLIELIVVIGLIAVLAAIVIAAAMKTRRNAQSVHCLGNLRQLDTAFRMYAIDDSMRLPDPGASGTSWEACLQSYLGLANITTPTKGTISLFMCEADTEIGPQTGSSYDWRDTGSPTTTLAGKQMTIPARNVVLVMEALPSWHAARKVNVGRLDGSVETIDDQSWIADLMKPVNQQ